MKEVNAAFTSGQVNVKEQDELRHRAHMNTLLRLIEQHDQILRMNARMVDMLTAYAIVFKDALPQEKEWKQ